MTSTLRVPALKAWQLKYWAFLTGMPSTGTKDELQSLLTRNLDIPPSRLQQSKIVSVDMGIRNLAFCALEATPKQKMKVSTWKRLDLLSTASEMGEVPQTKASIAKDAFLPSSLSKIALHVTRELLSHSPTTILIEQQRFRSGGAAAIQEWTVRVNMLESMLWACLATLQPKEGDYPEMHAVRPAQVADFWTSPWLKREMGSLGLAAETPATERKGRRKVDKKEKVDLVREWVCGGGGVQLEFEGEAVGIAEAFRLDQKRRRDVKELAGGKIDDLADCLLQAVAWVRWRENERMIREMWS